MLNESIVIKEGDVKLEGKLTVPKSPIGVVLVCSVTDTTEDSSQSIEHFLIEEFYDANIACLNIDLVSDELNPTSVSHEEEVFNVELLSERVVMTLDWISKHRVLAPLPIGLCAAHTAAAGLLAAQRRKLNARP